MTSIVQVESEEKEKTPSLDSHMEYHFASAEVIRDVIVGLSDGLTVPFALSAGLVSLNNSRLVLTAGAAEIVAGSISMALGGYLAGLSEIEHYDAERKRELWEVMNMPQREEDEIIEIFEPYGIGKSELAPMLDRFKQNRETWVDFMMKFELNMERPAANRSWISALTIGSSYFCGGLVPLIPYAILVNPQQALAVSAGVTVLALFIFGYVKSKLLGSTHPFIGALQMMFIGAAAAGAAYGSTLFFNFSRKSHSTADYFSNSIVIQ